MNHAAVDAEGNPESHHPGEIEGQTFRPEQAGFREGKSCSDQIAALRYIIEQSMEWQSNLYLNFIDYEKAFDSVDREVIWKLLEYYGLPQNIHQPYSTAVRQRYHMSSDPQRKTQRVIWNKHKSQTRVLIITNDIPNCGGLTGLCVRE
ncbi:unnamed protein product [Trichobilharzia regenti]|nr:unnamed protein product [Trichobilharzia regenti]